MIRYLLLILLLSLCFRTEIRSQESPGLNLTVKDGLPSNTVYSVFPDSKGYLWIGTDKGCARFNGRTFKVFTTSDGLPDNEVFHVREDHEGRFWVFTFKGSLCFYKDGKFHTKDNTPWLNLPENTFFIGTMQIEPDGTLWSISANGKHYLRIKGNHTTLINLSEAGKHSGSVPLPYYVRKQTNNRYALYFSRAIVEIDSSGKFIRRSEYADHSVYSGGNTAHETFMFSAKGIYRFTGSKSSFTPVEVLSEEKEKFSDTLNRALYLDGNTVFFSGEYHAIRGQHKILPDGIIITHVEKDYSGNLWVSSRGNGLYCVGRNAADIRVDTSTYNGIALKAKAIDDALYFVTSNGEYNLFRNFRIKKLSDMEAERKRVTAGNYLILNNGGLIQILSNFNFLLKPLSNGTIKKKKLDLPYKIASTSTKDIFEYAGSLYLSSISNLLRLNTEELELPHQRWETLLFKTMEENRNDNSNRIYARAMDPKDTSIWLSKTDGIFRIKDRTILHQPQFQNTLLRRIVFHGSYLIGFTEDGKLFISARYKERLLADTINYNGCIWETIYPLDETHLIIGTNKYYLLLSLHKPKPDGHPNYDIKVIEEPFLPQAAEYIVPAGNLCYFFKDNHITTVAKQVLMQTIPPPIPSFSELITSSGDKPISPEITLPYADARSIRILFDNICYVSKNITSQYSISENGMDNWIDISGNEINLNSQGYGTFTIKVRSKTLSSQYSKPAVLILHIQKPFWATWWFIALCILALLGLVWSIILFVTWRKLRKKQKEHEADMKYQQSEYKALNALMNPHFIFNSLNNIQGLINKDEKRTANQYLVIFSDLVRQNMHNISKGFISLQEELTLIENYLTLEKLRFKELVNYEIKIEEEVDVDDIMIPPLMIQPLVENAVKHGLLPRQSADSKVLVHVYEQEDTLYIIVEDNGIGLTASLENQNKLHESFGLSNLQKRTDHLKKIQQHELNIEVKEMKDSEGKVLGTRAVVTIQLA